MKRLCEECGKLFISELEDAIVLRDYFCSDECCEQYNNHKDELLKQVNKQFKGKRGRKCSW